MEEAGSEMLTKLIESTKQKEPKKNYNKSTSCMIISDAEKDITSNDYDGMNEANDETKDLEDWKQSIRIPQE